MSAQRYKVGYYTDEWGMSSNTPCLLRDDNGYAVKFDDYGTPYIDTPYVTNVINNTIVRVAYWGWQAATKAAATEGQQ